MFNFIIVLLMQSANAEQLQQLVAEALEKNPEITAGQKRYEAARQRPVQERSLPEPMLGLGYNSNGNPLPGAGLGRDPTSNIGFMLTQELPQPGKLRTRALIASKEADAAYQELLFRDKNIPGGLRRDKEGNLAFETHDPDGIKIFLRQAD